MADLKQIIKRKNDHLALVQTLGVEATSTTGLEKYQLIHQALPGLDFAEVDTTTEFLGKKLKAPLLVSSMTGGTVLAEKINSNLARACEKLGLAMGVGSQRVTVEKAIGNDSFQVRKIAPSILLFANLGAVQLNNGYSIKEAQEAVNSIGADGLFLHLNPLQEAIQEEGNKNFKNLEEKITILVKQLRVPLVVKETGNGISEQSARKLKNLGVKFVDTAGSGGTSWGFIEAKRRNNPLLAETFRNWGIPTAKSIIYCRKQGLTVIGSGGIRNGVEVAKAIALGASLVGIGLPLVNLAIKDLSLVEKRLEEIILELKIAMFCSGVKTIAALYNNPEILTSD